MLPHQANTLPCTPKGRQWAPDVGIRHTLLEGVSNALLTTHVDVRMLPSYAAPRAEPDLGVKVQKVRLRWPPPFLRAGH